MKQIYLLIILLLAVSFESYSQKFNVSEIDASSYPTVNANFSAFNSMGDYYTNISKSDFKVIENGLEIAPENIELSCTSNLPVNVVLVLDRSSSMNDVYNGETLWQWVIEGATTFINDFEFSDSAKIAITSFAGTSRLVCDFSSDKKELIDSLKRIPNAYGSTNFNEPFFDPVSGAFKLLQTRASHHRRSIVFLTDGIHESGTPLRVADILTGLNELNIRFFGISLMVGKSNDLEYWSTNTAGKSSFVSSKSALSSIYKTFAADLKMTVQCQLIWKSPDICDISETFRKVEIVFLIQDSKVVRSYRAPEYSIVYIGTDKEIYDFGDPPLGQTSNRIITITPKIHSFVVSDISIVPKDYFEIENWGEGPGNKPSFPFLMPEDVERKITVKYKPSGIRKYRQATLMINGEPCPIEIPLIGGFQQIAIDKPFDGQVISRCDTVDLEWSGIPVTVQVDLYYSTDGGGNWILIKNNITGNKYKWFPNFTSNNLLIKAKVSDQFGYDFVKSYGGAGNEFVTSVNVQNNGLYHLVSGYFSNSLDIGSFKAVSQGKEDFYVAKYDLDGNPIWVNTAGSVSHSDRANGVAIDRRGFVYATGYTYQGVRFGNVSPLLELSNSKYFFISKYSPAGQYINSKFIGGSTVFFNFEAEGLQIKTIFKLGEQNKIAVIGKYKGFYTEYALNATLPLSDTDSLFTAIFDEYLNLIELYPGVKDAAGFSELTHSDPVTQTKYDAGSFTGTAKIGGKNLSSMGLSDFWISKYAKNPVSEDISDVVEVVRPTATFTMNEYDYGPIVYGNEISNIVNGILINSGKLPYTITAYTILDIANVAMPDFEVKTVIIGQTIQPGDSLDIELWFKPGYLGLRKATLTVSADCAVDIKLNLKGNGVCGGDALVLHDFGSVNLNKQKSDTLFCVFKNVSETATVISPQIRGVHSTDFTRILPDYVKAKEFNGKITVEPNECIDIIVVFEPRAMGLREAEINFFVMAPCKNSITKLIGKGITSDVGITSFDWAERRVNGVYDAEVEIINNSNVTETVDNIQFEFSNPGGIFSYDNISLPLSLPANTTVKLGVKFKPGLEINYAENILVFIQSRQEPIVSNLTGIGILPKLNTSWTCGEKVNVGETAQASITLSNPSSSSVLNVSSIIIQNNDEFEFAPGTTTTNLVIDKNGSIVLPVLFTPISGGDNADNFIILADDYDGTFPEDWKTTVVPILCDGLEVDFTNPVDFGSLIVCRESSLPVKITNKSTDTDLNLMLSQIYFSDGDANQFLLPVLQDKVVKGGESYEFNITFSPKNKGIFNINLNIPNSMASTFKIEMKGQALGIELETDKDEVTIGTGSKFTFKLMAKFPQTTSGMVKQIKIKLSADPDVIGLVPNSFIKGNELGTDWNWGSLESKGFGNYEITGTGNLSDNRTVELFSCEFIGYLNAKHRTLLVSEIDYGCSVDLFDMTIINIEEVCFNDSRIIKMQSTGKFGITSPSPNPASQSFDLNFGIGFDVNTKIEIVNYFGQTVRVLYDGMMKAGSYQETISTSELSSGTYMIRMVSGPYSGTQSLLLVK